MQNRKKIFVNAVFIDFLGTPLTMIIGIVVTPLYFKFINNEAFGYWNTVNELMTLLTLINGGIGFYIIQTITKGIDTDKKRLKSELSSLATVQFVMLIIMFLISLIFFFILPSFRVLEYNKEVYRYVYILMILNLIINSSFSFLSYIEQGFNNVVRINLFNLIQKLIFQLLPLLLFNYGFGLLALPISHLTANLFLMFCILFFTINFLIRNISLIDISIKKIKEIFLFCIHTFIGGTSYYVLNFTDCIIIANFLGNKYVTIYILTMKLGNFLRFIVARILSLSFPVVSKLMNEGNYYRIQELTLKFFRFGLRIGLITSALIFFLNQVFVIQWVGEDKYGGLLLSIFSAFICLRESIFPVFSNIIFATKEIKVINFIFLIEAIINLSLSFYLIKIMGIAGVALATLLSFSILSIVYSIFKVKKIINLELKSLLFSLFKVVFLSLPSILCIWYGSILILNQFSWILFIMLLFICAFVNVIFFEGKLIFKYKKHKFKNLISLIIDNA